MIIRIAVCFLPAVLVCGVLILSVDKKWSLKERALYYSGKLDFTKEASPLNKLLKRLMSGRRKEKMIMELAQSLAYVENIVVLGRGKSISADFLLEELAEFCPSLSGVFINMARDISVHEKEHAEGLLFQCIAEPYAKDIGIFLAGWEDIPQEELICSIRAYKDILREVRSSRIRKRDELISDLVYFPVVVNCMMVLLNFVYVAYFIEQKEALMMLF